MRRFARLDSRRLAGLALALVCALVFFVPGHGLAQQPSATAQAAHEAFDAKVLEQLATLDPDVREQWRAANEAREAGDFEGAIAGYSEVLAVHGEFDHALRRRCSAKLALGRPAAALDDCEAAHRLADSPENAVTLAMALAELSDQTGNRTRAITLASSVLRGKADYGDLLAVCQVAMQLEQAAMLGQCADGLQKIDAGAWEGHFYEAFYLAMSDRLGEAEEALDRAHAAGLGDAIYDEVSELFRRARSPWAYYGAKVGWVVLIWISVAAALVAAGFALSRLTLSEAEGALHRSDASAKASDSWLHKAYATVLWLCCAYYYLSVPLVLLSVIALGGAIILGLLYLGRIPIKLVLIVVIVVFGSVFAVLKSFFTRVSDEDPGESLNLAEAPGLRAVLDEVAAKVGTRPVDRVYLTVGADIAVFERGGMLEKLRGKGERCLLLGVAVLEGMDTQAFKAILAHEYGHFSNEDTAGGNFALGVRRSVVHSAVGLAEAGAAGWYNPAWVFLRGFHRIFLNISQGASRLQEVLADRWSARCYGGASFERGLRHAIAAELRFGTHANATLQEVLEGERVLRNIYRYTPSSKAGDDGGEELEARVEEVIHAEPSPYDSHPRPADRFRWAHAISRPEAEAEVGEPAWSLFSDPRVIEERMTAVICRRVAAQTGVMLARGDDEADEHEDDDEVGEASDS